MELEGLVAVVTGAGRGIGRAIAERFFAEGAAVVLWDVDGESADAGARRLDPALARAAGAHVDVTDEPAVTRAMADAVTRFGRLDVLVNNAGILGLGGTAEMTVEAFERVLRVNVTGMFICCKAAIPVMTRQGRGKIVNISSLSARTGRPVPINYAASKGAVVSLTQTLAREVGPAGIYVNAIAPGPIATDMTEKFTPELFAKLTAGRAARRDGTPADVADAAVYLASTRSDWVTGVVLDVNGGILMR